jgi:two-component system, OmpR family, sensor histidine kinase KdpD
MQNKLQEQRPDPERLLEKINKEARGKFTVFLGAAAGVGKTYTMLETAHERLNDGTDVVIGWVETHGRLETERWVEGLPKVPPKMFDYRGKQLPEMDVDAILARKPTLVLVDELAHSNVGGSRHARRFQDVEELLDAGINVYTTLNIQHIESLNDVVAQITGIVVKETVPDFILEQADTIQLIDIPPEDLIKRLKEGKVYVPGQAKEALRHFFRPGNINALRELSLRFTASRVDTELNDYMREHQIAGPWPTTGRVMVCVSASPFSAQLIRVARRLAAGLQTEWLAVHIEESRRTPPGEAEQDRAARNMRLAGELGAKTVNAAGEGVAEEILAIARSHNVTSIVVGKPRHSKLWEFFHRAVVDDLIRQSGGINVYVIQAAASLEEPVRIATASAPKIHHWNHYVGGLLMVIGITFFGWLFQAALEFVNIALLYQLPVLFSAFWWGRWPSYFAAVCSVLAFDFLFVPPIFTFNVDDIRYLWSFITFLIVAFVIGRRTEILRYEATAARMREKNIRALFDFSREIAALMDMDTIVQKLVRQAADALNRPITVLLPDEKERLTVRMEAEPGSEEPNWQGKQEKKVSATDNAEIAVASWAYEHRQVAGRSTDTLAGAKYLYLPLNTPDSVVGVIGVWVVERLITPEQRRLMDAWAGLAAIAIERVKLTEKAQQATILLESDRLRTALFNSISHELRTPLSSILGSSSTLIEAEDVYSASERKELLETIREGANRMERLIANLLDTARLESGMMKLKQDWCDIEDIVGSSLRRLTEQIKNRPIDIAIPPDIPLLRADCVLLEQVLVNLVDNAVKYSPAGSRIEIAATVLNDVIKVSVADHGVGVPLEDLSHIFDKFYRVQRAASTPGTGLGLSICKGIVEAHGGQIWAENLTGGGVSILFTVPVGTSGQDSRLPESEE